MTRENESWHDASLIMAPLANHSPDARHRDTVRAATARDLAPEP